jgi:hypothetical protein
MGEYNSTALSRITANTFKITYRAIFDADWAATKISSSPPDTRLVFPKWAFCVKVPASHRFPEESRNFPVN